MYVCNLKKKVPQNKRPYMYVRVFQTERFEAKNKSEHQAVYYAI